MGSETLTEMSFGECATLIRASVSPSDVSGQPYIGLEHIGEGTLSLIGIGSAQDVTSQKTRFHSGDILFGKLRPYFRKVIRPKFDGVCSTDIWVVRPQKGIDAGYLYYWMASQEFVDIATRGSEGTKMPRAKWDFVAKITKQIPPLAEQRRIAGILGTFDDKIELNRRMNTTLEAMARALFQSWFVDFDPVRAKMDGRWRKGESLPGLPAAWWDLFPDRLVDSELGPIPEGWRVGTVGEVAEVIKGVSYSSDELQLSSTAMVTLKSFLRGGGYRTDGLKPFTGKYKTEQQVFPAELIVSFTDVTQAGEVIGQPALVHKSRIFKALVASLDVGIVRPRNPHVSTTYLYSVMLSKRFHEYIGTFVNGTTVLHLAKGGIPSYPLLIPFEITLRKWHSLCSPLTSMILELSLESEMLSDLRDQTMAILLKEK